MKNRINDYFVAAEGAFKKIGRILHDKRFVSFELSIKLWGKSGKPKQFSIEGRRSADGSWVQREPYLSVSQSDEALKERFAQIENRVRNYIATNTLDAQWSKLEGLIKKALHSGQYVDDLVNSEGLAVLACSGSGYEAHFAAPVIATAYAIAGVKALDNADLNHASYCLDQGLHWSSPKMLIPNPRERYKARASAGGKEKALNYEPVKDKVAELLETLAPTEGWKSLEQAIGRVADELAESYSELTKKCKLTSEDLSDTVRRWIRKDPKRFVCRIKSRA